MMTHCRNGHPMTPDNYGGARVGCIICRKASQARQTAKRSAQRRAAAGKAQHIEALRYETNRRGVIHYLERRRQRLAQQEKAA
jgi:hypothetical protein